MTWTLVAKSVFAAAGIALPPYEPPVSEMWANPTSLVSRTQTALFSSAEDIDPFSSRYMTRLYGAAMDIRTDFTPLVILIR